MDKNEQQKAPDDSKPAREEDHGFYFFPNRREGEGKVKQDGFYDNLKKGIHHSDNAHCVLNTRACAESSNKDNSNLQQILTGDRRQTKQFLLLRRRMSSGEGKPGQLSAYGRYWRTAGKYPVKPPRPKGPVVKLMLRAMKAHGCPVDFDRHISCEPCKHGLSGGFDHTSNQVVLCERPAKNRKVACSTMAHELLHAFDKCRAHFDFKDPRHVACAEIRAANLFHCSYTSSFMSGDFGLFNSKLAHQTCVKRKALASVLLVKNISEKEGMEIIDEVFKKCYNDFEPIGRRIRPKTRDPERALLEGLMYGYSET